MLIGTALVTAHLMMADCPTDKPNDPSCIYVVAMDIYGQPQNSIALCELNAKFLNPNMQQVPKRHLEARCWTPQQLRLHKTVL
jgi:hypothetical protein